MSMSMVNVHMAIHSLLTDCSYDLAATPLSYHLHLLLSLITYFHMENVFSKVTRGERRSLGTGGKSTH